jgi:glucosyl-3-phosphoglycerate synthase
MDAAIGDPRVSQWLERNTYTGPGPSVESLLALKSEQQVTVSVCLPALNEAGTIGQICELIRTELIQGPGLVDELVVMDSGSTDDTAEVASRAGATTYLAQEVALREEEIRGKGDCLWRSLAVLHGDIVVWLDSDTRNMHRGFITDLIGPLLSRRELVMTKAFYHRPLETPSGLVPAGGARVTELVVRPLLHLFYPELTGFVQPLAGEYAVRRDIVTDLPFFTGYAVEIGLLIDIAERFGVDSIAQADLGTRIHRNRPVLELGSMSFEVMRAMLTRFDELGRVKVPNDLPDSLMQFRDDEGTLGPVTHRLPIVERPPMRKYLPQP